MKFLIVEPSPLPILISLGPKYSPQDPGIIIIIIIIITIIMLLISKLMLQLVD